MGEILHQIDKKSMIKGLSLIGTIFVVFFLIGRFIGEEQLRLRVEEAGIWGPIILIAWKIITSVIAPFTGGISYVISGALYPFPEAVSFSVVGNFFGCSLAFLVGKKRGAKALTLFFKEKQIQEILHLIDHMSSYKSFIKTRFLLFPLEDFINFAAGMSKLRYVPYIIISTIVTTLFSLIPILIGKGIL